ncbi:MAG TPA: PQQ-binding-like beta-propeller repeat protein, partial [Bryobacteraceae bacterium]|nr:PQQ-binding-like beta-propeller repeat protein [Bryobacteraceae bacterium]
CPANPPMKALDSGPAWNGWGVDISNTRFQPAKAAGLKAGDVPKLKLKWAFGYPTGVSAHGQPSIVAGRVFVGTDTGYIYSLDAKTGCIYWSYETGALVRNAISIGPVQGHGSTRYAIYFGDAKANVHAIDAQNGELLWKKHVDDYIVARITAAPKLYGGRLYVPVSSSEEFQGGNPDYECCTSRGSVVALDANTGEQIWKTYVVPTPKPTRKNSKGTQLYGPAGGSVWNSPTVDPVRHAVYFGTGDAETEPADKHTDAVMAVNMDTGKELWTYQATPNDSFMGGCFGASKSENCPSVQGPDSDIGNSPILRTLPGGKRVLIAGTKEGDVFALDPDNHGKLLWRVHASNSPQPRPGARPGFGSGIVWGGAADQQNVYYGFSGGGMAALDLATGERKWFAPIAAPGTRVAYSAAATVIPGVVFVGGSDGSLHALSTADGHTLWQFDTAKDFDAVNKVAAHGGSIRAAGPVVAGGMLYVGSGYAVSGGDKPGNVLLAFGLE